MSWFKKKTKPIVYNSNENIKEFDKYFADEDEQKYYNDMYEHIKESYKPIADKDKNFICHERVRLQARTGKYNAIKKNLNINLIILALSIFINSIISAFSASKYSSDIKFLIIFGFGTVVYAMILYSIIKNMDKNDSTIFDLALQVLEDIEKEIIKNSEKLIINDEVTANVLEEEQSKNQVRPISNQANGNWNITISAPSIIDTVECVYKVGKFARKVFRKKRN